MNNTTKVVRTIEIGMEDDKTVVMRVEFNNSYTAIEWHDRIAASPVPFTLTFSGRAPSVVNMEKVQHPIESFPLPDKNEPLPPALVLAWFVLSWWWVSWLT